MRPLLVFMGAGLFGQPSPAVDPGFHYPKSSQVQVIAEGFRARSLSGTVGGTHGARIAGPVLVEIIRGPSDEVRIDARLCDGKGFFDFGAKRKGRYYFKVSMEGWDTLYFPVTIGSRGRHSFLRCV